MQPKNVTDTPKRYTRVFVCVACDHLAESNRADALTCGGACRVDMHRHPARIDSLRKTCKSYDIPVHLVLDCMAIDRLRPDLANRIKSGELDVDDVRGEVWIAFCAVLWPQQREVPDAA